MALRAFAYPTVSAISEWMYRERAEYHGRDECECAVERGRMKSRSGSPRKGTRVEVQAGFRR
jgi:hypothetical protein